MKPRATGNGLYIAILCLLFLCLPAVVQAGIATQVVVNQSVLLDLQRPSKRVSVAAPEIAELVVISPTELQINGKKIGSTTLIVWDRSGKTSFFDIQVTGDVRLLEAQIREIAPNDSIKVQYANNTIVLSGKVAHEQTAAKAMQLAEAYAAGSEGGGQAAAPAPPESSFETTPAAYQAVNTGSMGGGLDKEPAAPKGNGQTKIRVINQIQVEQAQQVVLQVKVAQVDRGALKNLGVSMLVKGASGEGFTNLGAAPFPNSNLQPQNGGEGINANAPGLGALNGLKDVGLDAFQLGFSVFKPGIGALLQALASKNLAKVLAEPNLLVRSGEVGKFLAGSKIPFSYVSGVGALSTTSIQFIDVGVKLNFKPVVLENGLISLKIDPAEVSSVSGTLAVNGYPIIDSREVRTQVQLRDGESLVLAGLLQKEAIKTMSKIPIMGDIPILGALFRNTQDSVTDKELVFFITPRLVTPDAPGTKHELPTDKPLTPEQERDFKWIPTLK